MIIKVWVKMSTWRIILVLKIKFNRNIQNIIDKNLKNIKKKLIIIGKTNK